MTLFAVRSKKQHDRGRGFYYVSKNFEKAVTKARSWSRQMQCRMYVVIYKNPWK